MNITFEIFPLKPSLLSGHYFPVVFVLVMEPSMTSLFAQMHVENCTTIHCFFSFLQDPGMVHADMVIAGHSGAGMAMKIVLVYQYPALPFSFREDVFLMVNLPINSLISSMRKSYVSCCSFLSMPSETV